MPRKYTNLVVRAKTAQEALAYIAQGIDEILDKDLKAGEFFGSWSDGEALDEYQRDKDLLAPLAGDLTLGPAQTIEGNDDMRTVTFKAASEVKQLMRRQFAENVLKLDKVFPEWSEDMQLSEAYAKGGPLWLYNSRRDVVMSFPYEVRQAMVADVEEDDPTTAQEMGRDVLKHASETGPTLTSMDMAT